MKRRLSLLTLAAWLLAACAPIGGQALVAPLEELPEFSEQVIAVQPQAAEPTALPAAAAAPAEAVLAEAQPLGCAVTLAPETPYVPPAPWPATPAYGGFWYGSDALWTALPDDGAWGQLARGEKVFWWRAGYVGSAEPQPELSITARRLDAPAPEVVIAGPATNAFHADFNWAMLSGVTLPNSGCWEITGHYQGAALSFVVWVAP